MTIPEVSADLARLIPVAINRYPAFPGFNAIKPNTTKNTKSTKGTKKRASR